MTSLGRTIGKRSSYTGPGPPVGGGGTRSRPIQVECAGLHRRAARSGERLASSPRPARGRRGDAPSVPAQAATQDAASRRPSRRYARATALAPTSQTPRDRRERSLEALGDAALRAASRLGLCHGPEPGAGRSRWPFGCHAGVVADGVDGRFLRIAADISLSSDDARGPARPQARASGIQCRRCRPPDILRATVRGRLAHSTKRNEAARGRSNGVSRSDRGGFAIREPETTWAAASAEISARDGRCSYYPDLGLTRRPQTDAASFGTARFRSLEREAGRRADG
jgi:hypothetical protein